MKLKIKEKLKDKLRLFFRIAGMLVLILLALYLIYTWNKVF